MFFFQRCKIEDFSFLKSATSDLEMRSAQWRCQSPMIFRTLFSLFLPQFIIYAISWPSD